MANRRQRRLEKRAKRANESTNPVVDHVGGEPDSEANAALSNLAKVVNMKEATAKKAKAEAAKAKTTDKAVKASRVSGLPALPKLPKSKKLKPEHPCDCGCGTPTRAKFAPGHDSYIRGWAIRVERAVVKLKDVPAAQQPAVKAMLAERKAKAKQAELDAANEDVDETTEDVDEDVDTDDEDAEADEDAEDEDTDDEDEKDEE